MYPGALMADIDPTPAQAPRLATDSMKLVVPGLERVAQSIARRLRTTRGDSVTVAQEDLGHDLEFKGFLHDHALGGMIHGGLSREAAANQAMLLASHLLYFINFEIHRRKTFWVSPSLAYLLTRTKLDIDGELLKPPFPSCSFVFTDTASLALVEELLRSHEPQWIAEVGAPRVVTVHVTETGTDDPECVGLNVDVLLDPLTGTGWPYLYSRNLLVRPRDRLEAILDSHFADIDTEALDPVFSSRELKKLLHLVINAILYSTSAEVDSVKITSPLAQLQRAVEKKKSGEKRRRAQRQVARFRNEATGEDVFYLPGKIPISQVEQLSKIEGSKSGGQLMTRFMVRGHWRTANPSWNDQRPRWISPYWKGPDLATVIEREYEMK